jgi:CheY-like chemotaxis protein
MLFARAPKKILIIDDNKDLLTFISKILEGENYVVFSTSEGKGAVDLARAVKPNLILLDILMPDMDGGEIERVLKIDPATRDIPIVYMTALVSREDEEVTRSQRNKRRLLAKPVTKERLIETIKEVLTL